jgi:hypothetical protein
LSERSLAKALPPFFFPLMLCSRGFLVGDVSML